MDVSIVIPTLNEKDIVSSALDAAWRAGAREVILADGGSCDGTLEVARSQSCQIVDSPPGRAVQMNAGARAARGDALLFLHADNWLEPGAVDQIKLVLENSQIHGGAFQQCIEAGGRLFRLLERRNAWRVRRHGLPYGDQGIFMRRDRFLALGGFPEVKFLEDVLLMKKFRRQSRPVLLAGPLHVCARRWQRHGLLRQTVRNLFLLSANRCGMSPDRLARFYARHDAPKD